MVSSTISLAGFILPISTTLHVDPRAKLTSRRPSTIPASRNLSRASVRCSVKEDPATTKTESRTKTIRVVASDVDGTLLKTDHTMDTQLAELIVDMMEDGIVFFPATGKCRTGAVNSFAEPLKSTLGYNCPGVYLQGLTVFGRDGNLIYENTLNALIVTKVVEKARELNCSWVAYSGESLVCEEMDPLVDSLTVYHEPRAIEIPDLLHAVQMQQIKIHKMLLLSETKEFIDQIRPSIEKLVNNVASLTQAQPDMLEILPFGASKGKGVSILLEHYGFRQEELLAIGDAENDLEMLKNAGIGCAVDNAMPSVKKIADYIVKSNNQMGVGDAIQQFVKFARGE
mmetsp:Transcript_4769/g.8787  ORF Transcript_4769/g.8787 Transcript_4769/m.8787 type:complete len:341 (+) Transcript_4769:91-1113(+)|eukprot:CAMPEP_0184697966 /NCGR_PEP_ID=MMETSP0313-20130426/4742_1 /TAXON_ID=2792 /ORGANISM="Porphyridium aerugineum, Strain SAG 1380-2" /LENGTH=340 /DNA_ID=CAMNT_0027156829 /DNA_START=68 /DNA_END=1090 /DNA_ORIENTATION=+